MKIIYTADLHGIEGLYSQLFRLAVNWQAEAIIIGGDLLPKHGAFSTSVEDQRDFITHFMKPKLEGIHIELPGLEVYAMMGNDDWLINMPLLEELQRHGLLRLLHNKKYRLGNRFEIIGYGNVPPTPFSIKDSERIDTADAPIEPQHFKACISTDTGIRQIDAVTHFNRLSTMEQELARLPVPRSYQKTVYVMHAPPFQTNLDILYDGRAVGSRAIRQFIEKNQPYLTLHGHIHEAPSRSGSYWDKIGNTVCINPGQGTRDLHAVVFELEDVLNTMSHTIFG
ncbi:MAG: metallophosphoesterase [Desulfobacterales bacterium]|nr:metallophosphoesterase [Desulfobacterales bacterium]